MPETASRSIFYLGQGFKHYRPRARSTRSSIRGDVLEPCILYPLPSTDLRLKSRGYTSVTRTDMRARREKKGGERRKLARVSAAQLHEDVVVRRNHVPCGSWIGADIGSADQALPVHQ